MAGIIMAPSDHSGTDSDLLSNFDMDVGDDAGSDYDLVYTGMLRNDIIARLNETFGSDFSSSRKVEADCICHMVVSMHALQGQEAFLQKIYNNKEFLINSHCLLRSLGRLLYTCDTCGRGSHGVERCPQSNSTASAMPGLDQTEGPAVRASIKVTAAKKAKKRSKQAAKRAEAEKAAAPTDGSSSTADDDLGGAAAKSAAASDAASLVDSANGRTADAAKGTQPPEQKATAESVPVSAAASVVHSADGGTADAAKDTQQPVQKEGAKQGRSSGAASKETGDADSKQGVSFPVESKLAARPGSAGTQDNHRLLVPTWESALAQLSLQQPAQPNDGANDVDSQPGSFGGGMAGSAWAVPAERGDGPASIGMPPGPLQHHDMPPREVAAGPEEEDDLLDLLGYLGADRA